MTDKIDTSDVRRFSPEQNVVCEFLGMWAKPDGDYVCWEEYEALAAERDRLAAQLAEARAEGFRRGIEAAAAVCTAIIRDYDVMKPDGKTYEPVRVQRAAKGLVSVAREDIRALPVPADLGGGND